jgi:hypothetical protein
MPTSSPGNSHTHDIVAKLYRAYFALLNDLRQGLASRDDVVMADAVRNPIGRQAIDASKQQIYAA